VKLSSGWSLVALSALASFAISWRLTKVSVMMRAEAHRGPGGLRRISRSGGIAIIASLALVTGLGPVLAANLVPIRFLAAGAAIAVVSLLDDIVGLPAGYRLLVHSLAAVVVVESGMAIGADVVPGLSGSFPAWVAVPVTLLFIVWTVNLYNFTDGIDGLACGVGVVGLAAFSWIGFESGSPRFSQSAALASAACLGLLPFNWSPARLFLGDLGSTLLGYVIAAFTLWARRDGVMPVWVAVLIFSPVLWDTTSTLVRRVAQGHSPFEAHVDHVYQRAVRLGYSHAQVSIVVMSLTAMTSASAILVHKRGPVLQWAAGVAWGIVFVALSGWIRRREGQPRPESEPWLKP